MNIPTQLQPPAAAPETDARRLRASAYTGAFDGNRAAHVITSDDEAIRVAAGFADEIREASSLRELEGIAPVTELERASELGLTGIFVPKSHGGAEVGYGTLAEVIRLIAEANTSVAQILIAQYTLGDVITDKGSDAQRDHFLPLILRGARIANAMTEARTRSAADIHTTLARGADGRWRLNGEKFYTTGSYVSHWFPVLAKTPDGVAFAFVARNQPGSEVRDDWKGWGQRATVSGTATFTDVVIEDVAVIFAGTVPAAHSGNTFAQLLHAALDVGIAGGALREAVWFLNEKARAWPEAGVERAAQEPHTIRTFGELKVQERAAEALVWRAAGILDRLRRDTADTDLQAQAILAVAAARAAADQAALNVSSEIIALGGARTALESWNIDRFWRNARVHTVHDPIRWRHHAIGDFHLNGVQPVDNAKTARRKDPS